MCSTLAETTQLALSCSSEEKRRRFINAYWLRPENAFWMLLRSDVLATVPMRSPCVDLCCGDGVFSFLHAGGRFAQEFDVFTGLKDREPGESQDADMFDQANDGYQPKITRPASMTIDCGTDHKQSLLTKASRLDCYDRLVHHDHNETLPFDDGAFQTAYCNASYWVDQIDVFLAEIRRITASDGLAVLQVKLDTIKEYTLDRHRDALGDRWLATINRGRFATWPALCDRSTWEQRFADAGFDIREATPFVTGTHAHVWDVGIRPIAPMLTKTMNAIHPHLRREIKRDWVDMFCNLLAPFCKPDLDLFTAPSEPVEIQYVLAPNI